MQHDFKKAEEYWKEYISGRGWMDDETKADVDAFDAAVLAALQIAQSAQPDHDITKLQNRIKELANESMRFRIQVINLKEAVKSAIPFLGWSNAAKSVQESLQEELKSDDEEYLKNHSTKPAQVDACETCEGTGRIQVLPDSAECHPCEDCQPGLHKVWQEGFDAAALSQVDDAEVE